MTIKKSHCIAAILLLLFITQRSFAQDKYHTVWYSADSNHLPQNSVKSITPDKYGFLWISTENGIVRYDGQNFKTYNSENIEGLTANRMKIFNGKIHKDSIVIINEKGEALLIKNRSIKRIYNVPVTNRSLENINKKTYNEYYSFIYSFKNGNYVYTSKGNIFTLKNDIITKYDTAFKIIKQFKYPYNASLQVFAINGNLYHSGKNNDYSLCESTTPKYRKFDRKFGKNTQIYSNTLTDQTFIYSDKSLYLLTEQKGILKTTLIFEDFDCIANNIASVYYDVKHEILFLGSTNKGLLIARKKFFNHNATDYHHPSGTDDVYYALSQYTNSSILASTGEIFNKNGETSIINIGGYTDKYNLIIDDNGDVWTKEYEMLYCFSKVSGFKQHKKWKIDNSISTMTKGLNGYIYISAFVEKGDKGGYLYAVDTKKSNPEPTLLFKMNIACSDIKNKDMNTLWAGSWDGIYKIHLRQKTTEKIKGIDKTLVRSIYAPNSTETWICTYNKGIYLIKDDKITQLPVDRKGYLLNSHCIIEDKHNFLWITTNKGIFQVSKQDVYAYAYKKCKNVYYHIYDKNAGFINNEFNGGCNPCGVYLGNETIFFPSMDGIVYYNPSEIKRSTPSSHIYIDEISIDGKKSIINNAIAINRNFERVQFFITSPYYGNPYNQNIDIKLEGPVMQDWSAINDDNVSFSTLPPGKYVLRARKLSGFGSKYIYNSVAFTITPAFWQTRIFTLLSIVFIVITSYSLFILRIRYIKHKNIQLEKLVVIKTQQLHDTIAELRKTKDDLSSQIINHKTVIRTITHDIKSPLNFMAITGKFLYNNIENPSKTFKEDIKAIYTSSLQLYNFVDRFLEYAKEYDLKNYNPQPYNLYLLVSEKILFFKNIAFANSTSIINNINPNTTISANRHLLSIILHNIIDNGVKNTFNGKITITTFVSANNVFNLSIEDTGNGMNSEMVTYYKNLISGSVTETRKSGIGLHIIIDLLIIMEGTMTIDSQLNTGTTIIISFPQKD